MKFDNRDFERGVSTTLSSIGNLSKALDAGFTSKATSGLGRMASAVKNFSFGKMGGAVDGISGKFVALSAVAVTALSRITNSAIDAGLGFARQFSGLAAAQAGFAEYEQKLGSIQTILANTGLKGEKGLNTVTAALDQLNAYSDKTIYNFGEMARNIGTFTAAGVDLETSVQSIKGIANIAALSGSNANQASTAMYQLSQAIASGKVGLQDWNSVVNAGMGGKVFQEALTNTAVAMGKIDESAVTLNRETGQMTINGASFRESISAIGDEKWLTSDVLTNTLAQFSGDLTDAQLKAQGFNAQQIKDIREIATTAVDAATKVKTITQLIGTVKEAMGSGWAKTWEIIIGDFGEAKELFTNINDVVGGFIQKQSDARNKVLQDWKDLGGRDDLLAGLNNLFRVFLKIARPIRNAFRDIFPPATGAQLAKITEAFRKFTEGLLFGKEQSKQIKEVFRGVFTVFKILGIIIGAAIKYVAEFFGILVTGGGGSALLAIASAVGRVITAIGDWLTEGDRLKHFFDMITDARNAVLEPLVGAIGKVVEAVVALASGDVSGFFDNLAAAGGNITDLFGVIGDRIESLGAGIGDFFSQLGAGGAGALQSTIDYISGAIDTLRDKLSGFGGGGGLSVDAGPLDAVANQVDRLSWITDVAGHIWDVVSATFGGIARLLSAVAPRIGEFLGNMGDKFLTFLEDASMDDLIKLINTGVFVMLYRSISKLADTTGGLLGFGDAAKDAFTQLTGTLSTMQNAVRAQMILAIASAVGILAASLIGISLIPKDKLTGALGAVSALLGQVLILMVGMGKMTFSGGVWALGPAMIGIATAMLIMAGALRAMEGVKWSAMAKMAAVLGVMTVSLMAMGNMFHLFAAGAAMAALAVGMTIMSVSLRIMEKVKWSAIGKMAVVLLEVGLTLAGLGLMGPVILAGAAAIAIMAPAMNIMTVALLLMSKVKWSTIGKLAVTLLTLSVGLTAMVGALPGAFALTVMAGALTLLMPVLTTLGNMDFGTFAKSLAFLITTLIALGTVGAVFGVMAPLIAAFGAALLLVGGAMVLVGAGTLALGIGLTFIAAAGAGAFAVLIGGITTFLAVLPQWIIQFGQAIGGMITVIRENGPPMVRALGEILRQLMREVGKSAPDFGRMCERLIEEGLRVIRNTSDDWIRTGIKLILDLLDGLSRNMKKITDKGTEVILKFLAGVRKNDDKIADAGVDTIVSLVGAIRGAIVKKIGEFISMGASMGMSLITGAASGIRSALSNVIDAAVQAVQDAYNAAKDWILSRSPSKRWRDGIGKPMAQGAALGLSMSAGLLVDEAINMGKNATAAIQNTMGNLGDLVADDMAFDPTIRPVLDLSDVQTEASKLAGILAAPTLNAGTSFAEAATLANEIAGQNGQNGGTDGSESGAGTTFIQNNYSPKAISHVDAYREGKNLLSLKRRELGVSS